MTYKLAKQLKDTGFPQVANGAIYYCSDLGERTYSLNCEPYEKRKCVTHEMIIFPTLSELIDACGDGFGNLARETAQWVAYSDERSRDTGFGLTPEEAVAKLWLELNK